MQVLYGDSKQAGIPSIALFIHFIIIRARQVELLVVPKVAPCLARVLSRCSVIVTPGIVQYRQRAPMFLAYPRYVQYSTTYVVRSNLIILVLPQRNCVRVSSVILPRT